MTTWRFLFCCTKGTDLLEVEAPSLCLKQLLHCTQRAHGHRRATSTACTTGALWQCYVLFIDQHTHLVSWARRKTWGRIKNSLICTSITFGSNHDNMDTRYRCNSTRLTPAINLVHKCKSIVDMSLLSLSWTCHQSCTAVTAARQCIKLQLLHDTITICMHAPHDICKRAIQSTSCPRACLQAGSHTCTEQMRCCHCTGWTSLWQIGVLLTLVEEEDKTYQHELSV